MDNYNNGVHIVNLSTSIYWNSVHYRLVKSLCGLPMFNSSLDKRIHEFVLIAGFSAPGALCKDCVNTPEFQMYLLKKVG